MEREKRGKRGIFTKGTNDKEDASEDGPIQSARRSSSGAARSCQSPPGCRGRCWVGGPVWPPAVPWAEGAGSNAGFHFLVRRRRSVLLWLFFHCCLLLFSFCRSFFPFSFSVSPLPPFFLPSHSRFLLTSLPISLIINISIYLLLCLNPSILSIILSTHPSVCACVRACRNTDFHILGVEGVEGAR